MCCGFSSFAYNVCRTEVSECSVPFSGHDELQQWRHLAFACCVFLLLLLVQIVLSFMTFMTVLFALLALAAYRFALSVQNVACP